MDTEGLSGNMPGFSNGALTVALYTAVRPWLVYSGVLQRDRVHVPMTEAGSQKTQTNPRELAVIADGYDFRLRMGINTEYAHFPNMCLG